MQTGSFGFGAYGKTLDNRGTTVFVVQVVVQPPIKKESRFNVTP